MGRLTWLLIGGGIIVTVVGAVAVVKARAEEEKKEEIPAPPTPTPTPVPAIPAAIEVVDYPTSQSQLYGFYITMASPVHPQILQVKAITSFAGPPYPEGIVGTWAKFRVIDAAGRGVPNVAVLIWSVPTRDDQSGKLSIFGASRSEAEALRILTDANGEISIPLEYELTNIKILEDRLGFGVCVPIRGRVKDIDVGQSSEVAPPLAWICYNQREARTDLKAYTINARIEGTVKSNLFVLSCQAIGKALW